MTSQDSLAVLRNDILAVADARDDIDDVLYQWADRIAALEASPGYAVDGERVAQLIAHRACCGSEHDPAKGKFHGFCVVCGVDWPCEYAGTPLAVPKVSEAAAKCGGCNGDGYNWHAGRPASRENMVPCDTCSATPQAEARAEALAGLLRRWASADVDADTTLEAETDKLLAARCYIDSARIIDELYAAAELS